MPRRNFSKFYILVILIAAIVLLIFLNSIGWLNWPAKVFYGVTGFIAKPFEILGNKVSGAINLVVNLKELMKENSQLKDENRQLTLKISELSEISQENKLLREELKLESSVKSKKVLADLIGFDLSGLGQYFFINRGKNDGVTEGQAVIFAGGFLVGKIIETEENLSKVLALTDSQSLIFALTQESRASGVVRGDHGVGLILDQVASEKEVKDKEIIVTSGLDSHLPKGLIIGQIESKISSESDVFQKFEVKIGINHKEIESVFVVLGNE